MAILDWLLAIWTEAEDKAIFSSCLEARRERSEVGLMLPKGKAKVGEVALGVVVVVPWVLSVVGMVVAEGLEARKEDGAWVSRLWVDGQRWSSGKGFFGVGPWGLVGGVVWFCIRAGCCGELI